jgi:hypothetical protein
MRPGEAMNQRVLICFVVFLWAGCATTPGGLPSTVDGGKALDGGATLDGGSASLDGGALDGGSATLDGGGSADGGGATNDGGTLDGGSSDGGGAGDGGAQDGGACVPVTISPASLTGGVDCSGTLDDAAIRAQVCGGTRIATGLYNESTGTRSVEWETDGDGSGHTILACRDTVTEARDLLTATRLSEFTGCEAETDDYFSFEATDPGSADRYFLRVNKCSRWPYVLEAPNSMAGQIGQAGPPGVTVDTALAAHVAQYLWFVERDFRAAFFLVGARPIAGPPVGSVLCEAERSGGSILVREVTYTVDTTGRNIIRAEQAKATIPANCP